MLPEKDPEAVCRMVADKIRGHELHRHLSLNTENDCIVARVRRLGTSTMVFHTRRVNGGLEISLQEQKIAFTHRPFMREFEGRFCEVVRSMGGDVLES
jgi:hypothetical protein